MECLPNRLERRHPEVGLYAGVKKGLTPIECARSLRHKPRYTLMKK